MARFYFFEKDGRCGFMKGELSINLEKYVKRGTISQDGIEYYVILEWNFPGDDGTYSRWLDEDGIRYIRKLEDLPEGAGVYIGGYGTSPENIRLLEQKGIPFKDKMCPFCKRLNTELLLVPPQYQCVILIDETHILYKHNGSRLPPGTITVNEDNYRERLDAIQDTTKPVYFLVYATFRKVDAERVAAYIREHHFHEDNVYSLKGLCGWSVRQGVMEEMSEGIKANGIDQLWIICNTVNNRSVKSMMHTAEESGAKPVTIIKPEHLPRLDESTKVGVVLSPVPYRKERELLELIGATYPESAEGIRRRIARMEY